MTPTFEHKTETETKLTAGEANPVPHRSIFEAGDSVPFDVDALYSYLYCVAEQRPCGTAADITTIFEDEFCHSGDKNGDEGVPALITSTVADRLAENGIAAAPAGDDLKRDALVTFFVDEYSRAFAANLDVPDPRGVPFEKSDRNDFLDQLFEVATNILRI